MELDRGQVDAAAVLSVGVPRPRPHHTSTPADGDLTHLGRCSSCTSALVWDPDFLEFGCDGGIVGMIYDSLRAPADSAWADESERKGGASF